MMNNSGKVNTGQYRDRKFNEVAKNRFDVIFSIPY